MIMNDNTLQCAIQNDKKLNTWNENENEKEHKIEKCLQKKIELTRQKTQNERTEM